MSNFTRRYQENEALQKICKFIADIILIIVFAYALITYTCSQVTVSGSSMKPEIEGNNTVLVNKMAYAFSKPKRYSVIAFELDNSEMSKKYIKRVVGLPGETIQIKDGKIYIDDKELENDVVTTDILTAGIAADKITLGKDEYFVLGDNRNNSEDSRYADIGMVKKKYIVGKLWFVISPKDKIGFLKG